MSIFDRWFKIKPKPDPLRERQSDSPAALSLHREFESHPSRGLTPAKLASILVAAEQGDLIPQAELFLDMEEKDAHISAELGKRKMAVKKLDWCLEPPRNASAREKKNAMALEELLRDELDLGALRMDLLDALGHGYSCVELGWDRSGAGLWIPRRIEQRSPTWFTVDPAQRNVLRLRSTGGAYGEPLQPWGWIPHLHRSRSGYVARSGLFRSLAWPYLFKNYSIRDLAEFLEIYGLPIRIGKYPVGAGIEEKTALMKALLSIGHHAAGIMPASMEVEIQTVLAQGNADAFMLMLQWCDAAISKAILGGTLTSQTGPNGNRSLGEVHNEVRLDIRDDDAKQIDQSLSAFLVYPIAMLNGYFEEDRAPSFVSDTQEPDDLALFADALPKLVGIGARIGVKYVNEKLKIPEPEDDEPVLGMAKQPEPAGETVGYAPRTETAVAVRNACPTKSASIAAAARLDPGDPTPITSLAQQLAGDANAPLAGWVDAILKKIDQAESFAALRDDLLMSYGALDSDELTRIMTLAYAAADLSGRYDVDQGA